MGKYGKAGQATDNNTAHAQCKLYNLGYKHSPYCFSTATLVKRKRLIVTLFVHCLSCLSRCLFLTLLKARF